MKITIMRATLKYMVCSLKKIAKIMQLKFASAFSCEILFVFLECFFPNEQLANQDMSESMAFWRTFAYGTEVSGNNCDVNMPYKFCIK